MDSRRESQRQEPAVPYVLDDGEGEVIRWFGGTVTIKASGPAFDVAVTSEVAGSEPPLHAHAGADEAFFVIEGDLTVYAGDEVLSARAGSFVFLPRDIPHTYVVDSGSARLLLLICPAGTIAMFSDAEQLFGERGMPARPRAGDLRLVAPALDTHGVTIIGPHPPTGEAARQRG